MHLSSVLAAVLVCSLAALCAADGDTLIKPSVTTKTQIGVVYIQGTQIGTSAYTPLGQAIQAALPDFSVFIAVPAFALDIPDPIQIASKVDEGVKLMQGAGLQADAPLVIMGHSLGGAIAQDYTFKCTNCKAQVLMGAGLLRKYSNGTVATSYPVPTLTLDGTLDGLYRVTRQAETYYRYVNGSIEQHNPSRFPVVIYEGVSHMQFASGPLPPAVKASDLSPEVSYDDAHKMMANSIANFLIYTLFPASSAASQARVNLLQEVQSTGVILAPLIASLEMEAFTHFMPACNSDYPMPNCPPYPRYPGPQKGTTPQVNCTCGIPWVVNYAQRIMGGIPEETTVDFVVANAIHSVSDIHPVHLPHLWSNDSTSHGYVLNITTVTEQVYSEFDSFDTGFFYTSASELRVKLLSRQKLWVATRQANTNFTQLDVEPGNLCATINQASLNWAIENASPTARARYQKIGQPLIMGKDVFHGNAGPAWIDAKLEYKVASDKSHVTVSAPCNHTPINYPIQSAAGYHYCKLLSPARAMEWIYIDGLRWKGSVNATSSPFAEL